MRKALIALLSTISMAAPLAAHADSITTWQVPDHSCSYSTHSGRHECIGILRKSDGLAVVLDGSTTVQFMHASVAHVETNTDVENISWVKLYPANENKSYQYAATGVCIVEYDSGRHVAPKSMNCHVQVQGNVQTVDYHGGGATIVN